MEVWNSSLKLSISDGQGSVFLVTSLEMRATFGFSTASCLGFPFCKVTLSLEKNGEGEKQGMVSHINTQYVFSWVFSPLAVV